ncbi:MAG TPA: histidinol dehydrogenase [Verrucomicrobia bacterium]|nr:histidinol dehydrogenase [Verrucomicrobiota bacterium]
MRIQVTTWVPGKSNRALDTFLSRPAFDDKAQDVAATVLADVKHRGDAAVIEYASRFDHATMTPSGLQVHEDELTAAAALVDPAFRKAAKVAYQRIFKFAKAGMKRNWEMKTDHGGRLGEFYLPFDRVGVYIPGGAAPLASTALMTATLAKAAGVPEIVACTPCTGDGAVNPYVLYALQLAGATEIYRVGGIHAIGLMAYGTRRIRKVQKIVGPGGTYVTAAKRLVYGDVALDLVAGPSEIAILADASANPSCVAMDLLSQAEHGTGHEKALLVSPSAELIAGVRKALPAHVATLGRAEAITRVAQCGGIMLVQVASLEEGAALCNRFAPEHLELMVEDPRRWIKQIRCAGAVFMGHWTPESAGDFAAGPSHVLPTGGAAAMFSGLTVDDFHRRSSFVQFTKNDLKEVLPVIEAFGRVEGLDAHARSGSIRFAAEGKGI